MEKSTDYPDLLAAKKGDEAALAAIIAHEMPLIRRAAARATSPGLDFDDAVQEGLIGLFFAIERYEEGHGAVFSTYAAVCIQNAIYSAKRAANRKKHQPLNQSVPIPDEQSTPGPEEQAVAREQVALTLQKAQTQLSGLEKQVVRLLLDGHSRPQIAGILGRSPKTVDNALLRARRKLK